MPLVRATLIALATPDGLWEVQDGVPLGQVYHVDVETMRTVRFYNESHQRFHDAEVVRVGEGPAFLPTSLLRLES